MTFYLYIFRDLIWELRSLVWIQEKNSENHQGLLGNACFFELKGLWIFFLKNAQFEILVICCTIRNFSHRFSSYFPLKLWTASINWYVLPLFPVLHVCSWPCVKLQSRHDDKSVTLSCREQESVQSWPLSYYRTFCFNWATREFKGC